MPSNSNNPRVGSPQNTPDAQKERAFDFMIDTTLQDAERMKGFTAKSTSAMRKGASAQAHAYQSVPQPLLSNVIIDAPSPIAPKPSNGFFHEDSSNIVKIELSDLKNRKNGEPIEESNALLNASEVSFLQPSVRESAETPVNIP